MKLYLGLILISYNLFALNLSEEPSLRVRIAKTVHDVSISGTDLVKHVTGVEQPEFYQGKKNIQFNCRPLQSLVKDKKPLLLAKLSSKTGLMDYNSSKYRGDIFLVSSYGAKGCDIVNKVKLETYISTLLPKEMNANWPLEALKAQAVAARSYAIFQIKSQETSKKYGFNVYYDIENSEKHQVSGTFFEATFNTSKAQRMTKGEVLLPKSEEIIPIFFHSKCGGQTRLPEDVWSNSVEGYKSVSCPFCHKHGTPSWRNKISQNTLENVLKKFINDRKEDVGQLSNAKIAPDNHQSPMIRLYTDKNENIIKKSRIRSSLGRKLAPSNFFRIEKENNEIYLKGEGFGHGVGLCQFGAYELAKRGYNYKEILSHYFPNLLLKKIY